MQYQFSNRVSQLKASEIREILKSTGAPGVISFAAGNPAPEAFPTELIERISADILRSAPIDALQYSVTEGYTPLREELKKFCKARYGIGNENDDLIIVSGAQQGIGLSATVLCNEGDTVICENPSFVGALNAFRACGANLVGVETDNDGMIIEKLEKALVENPNTKLIYLIPNFNNPTGRTMSIERRIKAYDLAKKYGVMILEDNPYGDLRFSGEDVDCIKKYDTEGIVIYCGTFSKVLAPGIRVGYVLAPAPVTAKIVTAKQTSDVHTNIWAQQLCHRMLTATDFNKHIQNLKDIYRRKCSLMLSCMEEKLDKRIEYTRPEGGLFVWCTLPEEVDMLDYCKRALEAGVAVVPGTAFLADKSAPCHSFRLNFSTPTNENIIKGIDILSQIKL